MKTLADKRAGADGYLLVHASKAVGKMNKPRSLRCRMMLSAKPEAYKSQAGIKASAVTSLSLPSFLDRTRTRYILFSVAAVFKNQNTERAAQKREKVCECVCECLRMYSSSQCACVCMGVSPPPHTHNQTSKQTEPHMHSGHDTDKKLLHEIGIKLLLNLAFGH